MNTPEEMKAEIERLKVEIKAQRAEARKEFKIKVSQKGAVSVYGLGRFPVTLYAGQWDTVLSNAGDIRQFISENASELKSKDAVKTA